MIPEFVGRLPVCGVLHELDEAALIKILTEPKNALVKQYQKKFDFDNVKLKFTEDALKSVLRQAVERKVGARGLMMILDILLDAMYTLPSQKRVKEFVITSEMVERRRAVQEKDLAASTALPPDLGSALKGGMSAGNDLQSGRLKGRDGNSSGSPP